jgi:hypothetical protein
MLQKARDDLPIFDRFSRTAVNMEKGQKRRIGPTTTEAI